MKYLKYMLVFLLIGCASPEAYQYASVFPVEKNTIVKTEASSEIPDFVDMTLDDQRWGFLLAQGEVEAPINTNELKNNVIVRPDKQVMYSFGNSRVSLICAPMMVCTVHLGEGEKIIDLKTGDEFRWHIENSYTGSSEHFKPLVFVKPLYANISSNLIVVTDQRVYSIQISSVSEGQLTPSIGFYYSDQGVELVESPKINHQIKHTQAESKSKLNFNYVIKGDKYLPWYPELVWDDGEKVYIRMPERSGKSELPVFLLKGGKNNYEMVNSRFVDSMFIIDHLFDQGVLVLRKNKRNEQITIIRKS